MSSQRRIDSARANGARSRGPKTPEGLARCAAAAITHGLTARQIVLPNESQDDFRALLETYVLEYQPQSKRDLELVHVFVHARWRLLRSMSVETDLFNLQIARQQPHHRNDYRFAIAFKALCDESRSLETLGRYQSHLQRTCDLAYKLLEARRQKKTIPGSQGGPNPNTGQWDRPPACHPTPDG